MIAPIVVYTNRGKILHADITYRYGASGPGGDADIGILRLSGSVDLTPHYGHFQGSLDLLDHVVYGVGELDDVRLRPAATGTGDQHRALLAQLEGLEYLDPCVDFLGGVVAQRDSDRVADAVVIHYRIAIGPNADRKALTLRTVPVQPEPFPSTLLAGAAGLFAPRRHRL